MNIPNLTERLVHDAAFGLLKSLRCAIKQEPQIAPGERELPDVSERDT